MKLTFIFCSSSDIKSKEKKEEEDNIISVPKEITSLPDEGWIKATEQEDFLGPIIFIIPGETFSLLKVKEDVGGLLLEDAGVEDVEEPLSTENVLIGQNLIPHVYSFKSSFGKYLTCDSIGQVSCNKDAVNPLSEWTLIVKPEGISLQNIQQKFLSFDPKTGRLRCDSETIGFNETFIVKCQADRKKRRLIEKFHRDRRSNLKIGTSQAELTLIEESESKKMQSFGWGRSSKSTKFGSSSDLKRAAEDGNLGETLLERRIKSKHDPFC